MYDRTNAQVTIACDRGSLLIAGDEVSFASKSRIAPNHTFAGRLHGLNSALNSLVYHPEKDFNGVVLLTVTANDMGHYDSFKSTAMETIQVLQIFVRPVLDSVSVNMQHRQFTVLALTPRPLSIHLTGVDDPRETLLLDASCASGDLVYSGHEIVFKRGASASAISFVGTISDVSKALRRTEYVSRDSRKSTDFISLVVRTSAGRRVPLVFGASSEPLEGIEVIIEERYMPPELKVARGGLLVALGSSSVLDVTFLFDSAVSDMPCSLRVHATDDVELLLDEDVVWDETEVKVQFSNKTDLAAHLTCGQVPT